MVTLSWRQVIAVGMSAFSAASADAYVAIRQFYSISAHKPKQWVIETGETHRIVGTDV